MSNIVYDVVFAGGGTTACLIAGRLTKADPSLKILVLEAGPHTCALQVHTQPARYFSHLPETSKTMTFHVANPSDNVGGRSLVMPTGKCVGGGSSVNFTMYTRAAASDYDDWETVYGNPGWGSKDLIPFLKKTETYQIRPDEPTHGYDGPLKVSYGGIYSSVGKDFLEAAAGYDKEREHIEDVNDMLSCNKYGRWPKWIDEQTGKRSDVPHHFIYNQEDNTNLKILDGHRVKRVIIENDRAVGVEYVEDTVADANADQTPRIALASRLVIVSAGAFGSPAILERSGIGAKDIVERAGVKSIVDLPGVGERYQDHNLMFVPYLASNEADTHDAIFRGDQEEVAKCNVLWTDEGKGLMASNGLDSGIKIRPTAEDLRELGSDFAHRWTSYFENAPDKALLWIGIITAYLGDHSLVPRRKYFSMVYFTLYPVATGNVHIKSDDPYAALDVNPNFLNNSADVTILKWGYKRSREYARRMGAYRGEFAPYHPGFSETSEASNGEDNGPVHATAPDISYTAEDDEAIDAYHRNTVQTTWHSLGTCAMKPREQGGVVDSRLNVYGITGLKVADLSIAPGNVGSNTYSSALVIGEKAAVIIAEDLGIKGV